MPTLFGEQEFNLRTFALSSAETAALSLSTVRFHLDEDWSTSRLDPWTKTPKPKPNFGTIRASFPSRVTSMSRLTASSNLASGYTSMGSSGKKDLGHRAGSKVFRAQSRVFSDFGKRRRSDFFIVVKAEREVRPSWTLQFSVRPNLLLECPAQAKQRCIHALCLGSPQTLTRRKGPSAAREPARRFQPCQPAPEGLST